VAQNYLHTVCKVVLEGKGVPPRAMNGHGEVEDSFRLFLKSARAGEHTGILEKSEISYFCQESHHGVFFIRPLT